MLLLFVLGLGLFALICAALVIYAVQDQRDEVIGQDQFRAERQSRLEVLQRGGRR